MLQKDNRGSIKLAEKSCFHGRTKDVDTKQHFREDALKNGQFDGDFVQQKIWKPIMKWIPNMKTHYSGKFPYPMDNN